MKRNEISRLHFEQVEEEGKLQHREDKLKSDLTLFDKFVKANEEAAAKAVTA